MEVVKGTMISPISHKHILEEKPSYRNLKETVLCRNEGRGLPSHGSRYCFMVKPIHMHTPFTWHLQNNEDCFFTPLHQTPNTKFYYTAATGNKMTIWIMIPSGSTALVITTKNNKNCTQVPHEQQTWEHAVVGQPWETTDPQREERNSKLSGDLREIHIFHEW